MLTAGGGLTPNTNKGRAGVGALTIPPNTGWDIKELLEIAYDLSEIIPHISYGGFAPRTTSASLPPPFE